MNIYLDIFRDIEIIYNEFCNFNIDHPDVPRGSLGGNPFGFQMIQRQLQLNFNLTDMQLAILGDTSSIFRFDSHIDGMTNARNIEQLITERDYLLFIIEYRIFQDSYFLMDYYTEYVNLLYDIREMHLFRDSSFNYPYYSSPKFNSIFRSL